MPQRAKDALLSMCLCYLFGTWGGLLLQGGRLDLAVCAWMAGLLIGVSFASAIVRDGG